MTNQTYNTTPPKPFLPNWPRYCPGRSFPLYRHLPGVTPHPLSDPAGHSYGLEEPELTPLTGANWRTNEEYLFGFDLFNYSYWWEAHEVWEGLWQLAPYSSPERLFLQGFIQLSAALLKWHQRILGGVQKLSTPGLAKLRLVLESSPKEVVFGVLLPEYVVRMEVFFRPYHEQSGDLPWGQWEVHPLVELRL